jgi:import receptor subunit TOM70
LYGVDFTAVCILDEFKDDNASNSMERVLKQAATVRAKERMKVKALGPPSTAYVKAYLESFRPGKSMDGWMNGWWLIFLSLSLSSIVDLDLPPTTDEASGDYYFALAYRSTLDKDYATAWKASEKAVALGCSPAYLPGAFNLKGTFAFLNRNTKAALDCLSKAIELDPSYVQCYLKRASIYVEQGK